MKKIELVYLYLILCNFDLNVNGKSFIVGLFGLILCNILCCIFFAFFTPGVLVCRYGM